MAGLKLLPDRWESLSTAEQKELMAIFQQVKNAAYEIIQLKGYTNYAIGLAVTDTVKAILRSQECILTVSSPINGLYGIHDVCLSLPTVVSDKGVLKTVSPSLSEMETKQLRDSAFILREVFNQLKL